MKPMSNNIKTELDFNTEKDDPEFTMRFRRDISLCIGIGFTATVGLLWAVVNAEAIDEFIGNILKILFI